MKIKYDILAFLIAIGLAIIFACLIAVWHPFSIFTGVFMCVASGIFTYWKYCKYKDYTRKIADQRYEDAYVYADETNSNFDPQSYTYDKKDERQIASNIRNLKTMIFVGGVLCAAAIMLIIYGFQL